MVEINRVRLSGDVKIGDIVIENLLGTGANLVATANFGKL
jgi:CxxC motif-containing protein